MDNQQIKKIRNNEQPSWLEKQKSTGTIFQEEIDRLGDSWKKDAFYDLYEGMKTGAVAKKYDLRIEYVSRWKHSEEYMSLMILYSRVLYLQALPEAINLVIGALDQDEISIHDKRKLDIANIIISKVGLFEGGPSSGGSSENPVRQINIFNLYLTFC